MKKQYVVVGNSGGEVVSRVPFSSKAKANKYVSYKKKNRSLPIWYEIVEKEVS